MKLKEWFLVLAKIEEDAAVLYQNFSEHCSEKLKPVALAFSQEEERHKNFMLELFNNETFKEKPVDNDGVMILQQHMDYLENNGKNLDLTSEKEFFQFALQLEKNFIEIYTRQLSAFEVDSDGYKRLEDAIKEEKKHMIFILNKLYELK